VDAHLKKFNGMDGILETARPKALVTIVTSAFGSGVSVGFLESEV
jgi:hypothetical protein